MAQNQKEHRNPLLNLQPEREINQPNSKLHTYYSKYTIHSKKGSYKYSMKPFLSRGRIHGFTF